MYTTALSVDFGDGITTVSALLLLAIYKTIHYLIQSRYCQTSSRRSFLLTTVRPSVPTFCHRANLLLSGSIDRRLHICDHLRALDMRVGTPEISRETHEQVTI